MYFILADQDYLNEFNCVVLNIGQKSYFFQGFFREQMGLVNDDHGTSAFLIKSLQLAAQHVNGLETVFPLNPYSQHLNKMVKDIVKCDPWIDDIDNDMARIQFF